MVNFLTHLHYFKILREKVVFLFIQHTACFYGIKYILGYNKPPRKQTNLIYFLFTFKQIDNLGFKEVPVNVSLTIPIQLEHSFEIFNYNVTVAQVWWNLLPLSLHLMWLQVS